jgi:catechol 2,3-dioxygenase-like lactoylglutathione lyase family enzyme
MLTDVRFLALEVRALDRARAFYTDHLGLDTAVEGPDRKDSVALDVGDETALVLRRPTRVPRGGVHTHYALSVPAGEYNDWYDRLSTAMPTEEFSFGSMRSVYVYDPDHHCVELAGTDVSGPGVDGLFEVVLEVEKLDRAEAFYRTLGFDPVDRGPDRVRLRGPTDLELWEPRLGIADARGGVHVDVGFGAEDPSAVRSVVEETATGIESVDDGVRFRDPDGHVLTVRT